MSDSPQSVPQIPPKVRFGATVLYVNDVPAALEFYRRAFGFETRFFDEALQFGELNTGSAALAFASHGLGESLMPGQYMPPVDGRPGGVEIAFFVDDVPATVAKAIDAGAAVLAEPRLMPWGQTVAYVRGVEGSIIGLCTPLGG
jgi:lactoylglutathione lyase